MKKINRDGDRRQQNQGKVQSKQWRQLQQTDYTFVMIMYYSQTYRGTTQQAFIHPPTGHEVSHDGSALAEGPHTNLCCWNQQALQPCFPPRDGRSLSTMWRSSQYLILACLILIFHHFHTK